MEASISRLKAGLSSYLKRVKAGEEIVVTDRGKAVARVVPFIRAGATLAEHEEMVKAGIVRPALKKLRSDFWDMPAAEDPEGLTLQYLLEERRQGR